VGVGVVNGGAGLESRDALKDEISQEQLVPVELMRKDQLRIRDEEREFLRHDADDGAWLPVDDQVSANHRRIAPEPSLPVSMGQQDGPFCIGLRVGLRKPAPERRFYTQRAKNPAGP